MTSQDTTHPKSPDSSVRKQNRLWRIVYAIWWTLAALIAILAGAALALFQAYDSEFILPGVETLGIDLGKMTRVQAADVLRSEWEAQQITLIAGESTSRHSPSELGLVLDVDDMTRTAFNLSRTAPSLFGVLRKAPPQTVQPDWRADLTLARNLLVSTANDFDRQPVDATLTLEDGRIETTPSELGRTLDVTASLEWLRTNAGQVLEQGRWEPVTISLSPQIADLGGPVAEVRQLMAQSIRMELYDPIDDRQSTWTLNPEDWTGWLDVQMDESDPTNVEWQLNEEKAAEALDRQVAERFPDRYLKPDEVLAAVRQTLTDPGHTARLRLYHQESQYTVKAGDILSGIAPDVGIPYPWIQKANPGMGETVYAGQVITIPSPDVLLPLPVVESKRITISLSAQTVWVYEEGKLVWEWPCSTGLPSSPTAPGIFQVQSHELNAYAANWDLWMPHFLGIYQPVPDSDFMNGLHGFPSRGDNQLLWVNHLGRPVTFGCIMISSENAELLYDWAEEGTIVEIHR